MKKLVALAVVAVVATSVVGCGGTTTASLSSGKATVSTIK